MLPLGQIRQALHFLGISLGWCTNVIVGIIFCGIHRLEVYPHAGVLQWLILQMGTEKGPDEVKQPVPNQKTRTGKHIACWPDRLCLLCLTSKQSCVWVFYLSHFVLSHFPLLSEIKCYTVGRFLHWEGKGHSKIVDSFPTSVSSRSVEASLQEGILYLGKCFRSLAEPQGSQLGVTCSFPFGVCKYENTVECVRWGCCSSNPTKSWFRR